nr:MAG TPA: hypothetical protein [Caudoviricetes sp.]
MRAAMSTTTTRSMRIASPRIVPLEILKPLHSKGISRG